tara:strand:+ start:165 stop:572 length:408 start_codon:yes stop_codon:yes gene_type:complete
MNKIIKLKFFSNIVSEKQASDTGMSIVLVLLLIGFFSNNNLYYKLSIPALIINMIFPLFYYFPAILWLGFSKFVGSIVSRVLLMIVYVLLVIPIGVFRKLIGIDSLRLLDFKKSKKSVMKVRNHTFTASDMESPY